MERAARRRPQRRRLLTEVKLKEKIKATLGNIKGVSDINDDCGPAEIGIDLVFKIKDVFGKDRIYGMQLKSGDITCSQTKTNKGIREIIGQVTMAFGRGVESEGNRLRLDGIYLVTNGTINKPARDHISAACGAINNFHYIDGERLTRFFIENPKKR